MDSFQENVASKKKCECRGCQLSKRVRTLLEKLPEEFREEAGVLIDDMWMEMEADSTDLGVLRSKISGVWPSDHTGGKYYERIDGELYEVRGIKVEENAKKEENLD